MAVDYTDGSFNPTNTLTRGAAAKIICNLILGPTTAAALVADAAPYSDVPTTNTFAGYIAYCAKEGIISGYADGTFRPAASLSGYAFMKMLLGALGYDATAEGYTGANWSINVAKRALNVGLDDDLTGDFNGTKAVTREEACLYAFNTLKAPMVEYANSSSVTVNGITFTNKSDAKEIEQGKTVIIPDEYQNFCEKYFTKLDREESDETDDLGRPAITWSYDGDEVGTYAKSAKYTVVLSKDYATDTDIEDELQDLTKNNKLTVDAKTKLALNGDDMKTTEAVDLLGYTNDKNEKVNTTGVTLELFCTKNHVDKVVAYFYKVAKIADVDDNVTKADARKDVTCYVELKNVDTFNDNDIPGSDAKTYVKDAYVAYVLNEDGEIVDSFIADEVEGSLTTIKGNDYATMSGSKYYVVKASGTDVSNFKTGSDSTYKLFLDKNGYVIGTKAVDEDAASLDEIYYVAMTWVDKKVEYGVTKDRYYAQLVDMTGKVTEVETEIDYSKLNNELVTTSDKKWTAKDAQGNEVTYKANNKLDLKAWDNDDYDATRVANYSGWKFTKDMTRFKSNVGTFRFNSSTQYITIGGTGSDIEAKVKTGGIALTGTSDMKGYIITEDDSMVVLYAIVFDTKDIDESNTFNADNLVYIDSVSSEKGDGYRIQEVYTASGKAEDWKVDEGEYPALKAGKFYAFDTNDDGYYVFEEADAMKVASLDKGVWDDEEGVLIKVAYKSLFENLLTVEGVEDIDVSKAAFVDLHDTDATGEYDKTVKSLTALDNLFDKDGYNTTATLSLSVSENGAVLIVVTNLTHVKK